MSSLSLKFSKVLRGFLPGHKFTICVGRVIGVVFKSNQGTSVKRRAFRMLYSAYAVVLNLCVFTAAVDWICNVLPSLSSNISPSISGIVGQGFSAFYAVLVVVYRLYLLMIAAPLSSFVRDLEDSGTLPGSRLSSFKICVNSLVSVYFFSESWAAIWFVGVVVKLKQDSWWVHTVVRNKVLEHLVAFVAWPAGIVSFVAFAIVITTLDRLLDLLQSFVKRAQGILGITSGSRFGKNRTNREPSAEQPLESNIFEMEHLLSELQKIQELFDRYDQLLGPLIFLLISNSTIGFVDAITEVVQSKVKELDIRSSFIKCLVLFNHLLPFTLLNIGYLAKRRIRHLRISLKRDIAAAMARSWNQGLVNLYRNIHEWNWKMSAAGFFTVDRSLVTGIVSASLTYIVLLFQIQGVLKAGSGDDDQLRKELLRLLTSMNGTQCGSEPEH